MAEVFISYSWDDKMHEDMVLSFTNFLRENGFDAEIDKMLSQKETAINFMKMMHQKMNDAQKVIIVLSKGYKTKADTFKGGVGKEYSLIINDIESNDRKYLLVSFNGIENEIVPFGFGSREVIDLSKDKENGYEKLFSKLTDNELYQFSPVAKEKKTVTRKTIEKFNSPPQKVKIITYPINTEEGVYQYSDGHYQLRIYDFEFFRSRLRQSFPGTTDLEVINDPKSAVKRLMILFKDPILFGSSGPLWWFRGGASMPIKEVCQLTDTKIAMDNQEMEIVRVAACIGLGLRVCVYVEIAAEKPIGINKINKKELEEYKALGQSYTEEYGIFQNRIIKAQEHHDGFAVIDGEIINVSGSNYRERHLLPYNFVISTLDSPINSNEFDKKSKTIFINLLKGKIKIRSLINMLKELPKHGHIIPKFD